MRSRATDLATRQAYDVVADDYARMLPDMTLEAPLDRAVLSAFVEMVAALPHGPVADLGCGSGRVTAHLVDAGLRAFGLDVSPGMVSVAAARSPDISFVVADMETLPLRPGVLAGVLAWYSLIHVPADALLRVFGEFARVTLPGAPVLVAFQAGKGERLDRNSAYGHAVPLTYYRHAVDEVASALVAAGFHLHSEVHREPVLAHESTAQAFIVAQRSAVSQVAPRASTPATTPPATGRRATPPRSDC